MFIGIIRQYWQTKRTGMATTALATLGFFVLSGCLLSPEAPPQGEVAFTPITHQEFWVCEPELYGYKPDVDANPVAFDQANRPYVVNGDAIITTDNNGEMLKLDFAAAIKQRYPKWDGNFRQGAFSESHLVFGAADDAYLLVNACRSNLRQVLLLYSTDHCRSWKVIPVCQGKSNTFTTIEHRDGNSELKYPPAIIIGKDGFGTPGMKLVIAEKTDSGLTLKPPVTIAERAFIIPIHSGGGNIAVSIADNVHFFWANDETKPGSEFAGTPQYCRTYNRKTGQLSKVVFLGYGGSGKPDNHNLPSVSVDSKGIMHVLLGAHHDQFLYTTSLKPNSTQDGWSKPVPIGIPRVASGGSYTYIGLVCDQDDTLHSIARWAGDGYFFRLAYLRKKAGGVWEKSRVLVSPFKNMYSCWYHKLSVDREGRVFCSYDYLGAQLNSEQVAAFCHKFPGKRNYWVGGRAGKSNTALIMTDDHGDTWSLTTFKGIQNPQARRLVIQPPTFAANEKACVAQLTGQLGGAVSCGPCVNGKLYLGIGTRLAVMDLSSPTTPRIVAQSKPMEQGVRCVAVNGQYVYAGIGNRVYVFKLDKDGPPTPLSYATLSNLANKLEVNGKHLLAATESGLHIFDTSPGERLSPVSVWKGSGVYDFDLKGNQLYVAAGNKGLVVLDIKNPRKPIKVSALPGIDGDRATGTYSVTVEGNTLYAGPAPSGIVVRVCDVSNPQQINEISRLRRPSWSWGRKLFIRGKYGYYPAPNAVHVLDLSNPQQLTEAGSIAVKGGLRRLIPGGKYLIADMGTNGIEIIDITNPGKLTKTAAYAEPVCPWGIATDGEKALVADWQNGLYLLDISQPNSPRILGLLSKKTVKTMDQKKSMLRVAMQGDIAFLATAEEGVWTIDLSNPTKMRVISKLPMSGARDLCINNGRLFVADNGGKVKVFSIGEMGALSETAQLTTGGEILSLASSGNLLWVGQRMNAGSGRVVALDISDLTAPKETARLRCPNDIWGLHTDGKRLYVSLAQMGTQVIDITDPATPSLNRTIKTPGNAWQLSSTGKDLYLANGRSGVFIVRK